MSGPLEPRAFQVGCLAPVSLRDINAMSSLQGYIDRTLLSFYPQLN